MLIYSYADSMTRYTGSFQILFLDCPLSIDRKIPLINLARYAISGQSDKETESSFNYSFVRIRYQINYHSSLKYVNFIQTGRYQL